MAEDTKPHHQFVVSNDAGLVIRCCIHCGLSHEMGGYQNPQTRQPGFAWNLILEEKEDRTFSEPCPGENGSDDPFPYHHFILSNHHRAVHDLIVIRFCVRCGLSHRLNWDSPSNLFRMRGVEVPSQLQQDTYTRVPHWWRIQEKERDMTVSDGCPVEQESDASERRYVLVPRN